MSSLRYDEAIHQDLQRIVAHLRAHEVEGIEARIGEIFEALELLARHPLIGRPAGPARRELVIGRGSHGYVARYRYDPLDDAVIVLALRAQREAGFEDLQPLVRPVAVAAKALIDLRERWFNPPEQTERVPEVVPLGMDRSPYPDTLVAKAGHEQDVAKRTLTNLYNQRPAWLVNAHAALDAAVAAAYGWTDWSAELADDEILRRLLALNRERSGLAAAAVSP